MHATCRAGVAFATRAVRSRPVWMFLVPSTRGAVYPRISFLYSLADKTRTILHPQSGSTVYSLLAGTHSYARHELHRSTLVVDVEVNEIPSVPNLEERAHLFLSWTLVCQATLASGWPA